jgi:mRNA-degrading endonuclease toxin of MazEF toxin-antitoxin module
MPKLPEVNPVTDLRQDAAAALGEVRSSKQRPHHAGRVKGCPFEVVIPRGLPVAGVVLSDQAKSLDWKARKAEFIYRLLGETTLEALQKLTTLLSP